MYFFDTHSKAVVLFAPVMVLAAAEGGCLFLFYLFFYIIIRWIFSGLASFSFACWV